MLRLLSGLYRPFDLLTYYTIRVWKKTGVFKGYTHEYFQISGFISSLQYFSLLVIISFITKFEGGGSLIGFISIVVGFTCLIFFNYYRYKRLTLQKMSDYWNNETRLIKRFLGLILILYFGTAFISVIMLVSKN